MSRVGNCVRQRAEKKNVRGRQPCIESACYCITIIHSQAPISLFPYMGPYQAQRVGQRMLAVMMELGTGLRYVRRIRMSRVLFIIGYHSAVVIRATAV
jgi:hypothetical protein